MKRLLVLPLILLLAANSRAQVANTPLLKENGLQADAAILRSAYEQLHPGLYRYNSKAEMDDEFAALNLQLNHDQTL